MIKKYTPKNLVMQLSAFLVLGISYLLCQYSLFDLHGMKQWPVILAIASLAIILLSSIIKKPWLSLSTAFGYICGFGFGYLFSSASLNAGGGLLNNLWLIWMSVWLTFIVIGLVFEIVINRKNNQTKFT